MLSEMAADNYDTIRLNTLSDSIGYLHADLKKVTYKYYLDIKNICDQQQQQKLEQLFAECLQATAGWDNMEKVASKADVAADNLIID